MKWFQKLFNSRTSKLLNKSKQKKPLDWDLTIEDLFNEVDTGKRKSIGNPEIEWAIEYEQSLIPEKSRFPKKEIFTNQTKIKSFLI